MIVQELSLIFFPGFANLHNPYVQVLKMRRVRWLCGRVCVTVSPSALCEPDSTFVFITVILKTQKPWKLKSYLVIHAQY